MKLLMMYGIPGIALLLLLAMGIYLIRGGGKGAMTIAGFNTMRKEKREQYDTKALCRFMGWLCIAVDACVALSTAGDMFRIPWLTVGGVVLTFILVIAALIYVNTGGRFKKKE